MRIIFAGTPANAAHTLDALVAEGLDVIGVLTREDAPVGRKKVQTESAVAGAAARHGIQSLSQIGFPKKCLVGLATSSPTLE